MARHQLASLIRLILSLILGLILSRFADVSPKPPP
jgi:hypothetical protein